MDIPHLPPPDSLMSGGGDPFLATPDNDGRRLRFSLTSNTLPSLLSTESPTQARQALEAHLAETERRLQDASDLGTILVQQRAELTEKLQDLNQLQDGSELDPELKKRLVELEREFTEVGKESARAFIPRHRVVSSHDAVMADPTATPTIFSSGAALSPTKLAGPLSRKQRNLTPGRVNDIKLATDISTSLLNQVRELQVALAEKEDLLRKALIERSRLEVGRQNLTQRIKALDESEQRYKDENWALETRLHEQQSSHSDLVEKEKRLHQTLNQVEMQKLAMERELEELKQVHTRTTDENATLKKMHDAELATLRRGVASADAERSALHSRIDELVGQNKELAQAMAYRMRTEKAEMDLQSQSDNDDGGDGQVTPDASPPVSPAKGTPRHGHLESETLKSSLNHALRMIQNLKNQIHREKAEKVELKRQLQDAHDEVDIRRNDAGRGDRKKSKSRSATASRGRRPNGMAPRGSVRTDIVMNDPDWEDSTLSQMSSATVTTPTPRPLSVSESSAFETAREFSDSDPESTRFFQPSDDEGDATETESATRSRVNRSLVFRRTRGVSSGASTSSTSDDELDDQSVAAYPPVRALANRYPAETSSPVVSPGSLRHMPSSPMTMASPQSTTSMSSMAEVGGQSLAAELDSFGYYRENSIAPSIGSVMNSPQMASPSVFGTRTDHGMDDTVEDFSATAILAGGDSPFMPVRQLDLSEFPIPPVRLTVSDVAFVGELVPEATAVSVVVPPPVKRSTASVGVQTDAIVSPPLEISRVAGVSASPKLAGVSIVLPKPAGPPTRSEISGVGLSPKENRIAATVVPVAGFAFRETHASPDHRKTVLQAAAVSAVASSPRHLPVTRPPRVEPVRLEISQVDAVTASPVSATVAFSMDHCPHAVPVPVAVPVPEITLQRSEVADIAASPRAGTFSAPQPPTITLNHSDVSGIDAFPVPASMIIPPAAVLSTSTISGIGASPLNGAIPIQSAPLSLVDTGAESPSHRLSCATIRASDFYPGPTEPYTPVANSTIANTPATNASSIYTPLNDTPRSYFPQSSPVPVPPIPSPYRHAVLAQSRADGDDIRFRSNGRAPLQSISGNYQSPQTHRIQDDSSRSRPPSLDENDEARLFAPDIAPGKQPVSTMSQPGTRKGRDLLAGAGALRTGPSASPALTVHTPGSPSKSVASRRPTPGPNGVTTMPPPPPPPIPSPFFGTTTRSTHLRPTTPNGSTSHRNSHTYTARMGPSFAIGRSMRSEVSSPMTHRSSISSFVSEMDTRFNIQPAIPEGFDTQTDPRMIQAITQTMIGEWLWKYTRKPGRSEMSATRHKRFFWVHPYTRTLYWSEQDPSNAGRVQLKAKSVAIEAVRVVVDDNPYPPGLHKKSLIVITPGRTVQFTAPTGQRHDTWFNSLSYLLLRTSQERAGDDDDVDGAGDTVAETPTLATTTPTIVAEEIEASTPSDAVRPTRPSGMSRVSLASLSSRMSGPSGRRRDTPAKASSRQTPYNTPVRRTDRVEKHTTTPTTASKPTLGTRRSMRFGTAIGTILRKPSAIRGTLSGKGGPDPMPAVPSSLAAMDPASYDDPAPSLGSQTDGNRPRRSIDEFQSIIAARERDADRFDQNGLTLGNAGNGLQDSSTVGAAAGAGANTPRTNSVPPIDRLENAWACCDGRHDVSSLSRKPRFLTVMARSSVPHLHAHGAPGGGGHGHHHHHGHNHGHGHGHSARHRHRSQNLRP